MMPLPGSSSLNQRISTETHKVTIDAPVSICQVFGCNHVCIYIYLEDKARDQEVPVRNAFTVLMASSQELV